MQPLIFIQHSSDGFRRTRSSHALEHRMQLAIEWAHPGECLARARMPIQMENVDGAFPQRLTDDVAYRDRI